MDGLHAGAAVADITPYDAQFLFGYPFVHRYATGVNDRLYSSALYLTDGHTPVVFIANDIIFVTREMTQRIRDAISQATGVSGSNIVISATHTHSAPKTVDYLSNADDSCVPPVDPSYLAFFERQVVEAAVAAIRDARPARAGLVVADAKGVGTNRRDPRGPADPEAPALVVKARESRRDDRGHARLFDAPDRAAGGFERRRARISPGWRGATCSDLCSMPISRCCITPVQPATRARVT